jgi:serine/threonine-protein kinase
MVLVLLVAGMLSAVTAMRFAIQGTEVEVPDLAGASETEASQQLSEHGLDMVVDGRRFSPSIPEGGVLEQSPRAGARVKSDRRVRVRISLGEREFAVPDVLGASLRSTELQLEQRGLVTGSTLYAHTSDAEPGVVVFQSPEPGATESDPAVSVLVSLGTPDRYFVMPNFVGGALGEARGRVRDGGFRLSVATQGEPGGGEPGRILTQQPPAGHRIAKDDLIVLGVSR